MNTERVFWMVWEPGSGRTCKQHDRYESAADEAIRLARQNPGKRFYVLKAVSAYQAEAVPISETILLEV